MGAPAARAYEFSKRWVAEGHKVSVICGIPNHPVGKIYPGYEKKRLLHEIIDGIDVYRTWVFVTPNAKKWRRSFNFLSFGFSAALASHALQDVDVCIATTPQFFSGVSGTFVKRLLDVPLVLEVRDLWPDSIQAVRINTSRAFLNFLRRIERSMYRQADRIVIVSDAFRAHLIGKGVPDDKIHVVTNGVATTVFDNRPRKRLHFNGPMNDKFIVAYFGTQGLAHGLETMIDAARRLQDEPDYQFVIVGEGAEKKHLKRYANDLSNVVFIDRQTRERVAEMLNEVDLPLVLLRNAELFKTVIPSKMFEIMGSGKPMVLGVDGEAKRILLEAQAGIAVEPQNTDELVAAIQTLKINAVLRKQFGENAYRYVREHYNLDTLAQRYLTILQSLC